MNVAISRAIRTNRYGAPSSTVLGLAQFTAHETVCNAPPGSRHHIGGYDEVDEDEQGPRRSNWLLLAFLFSHVGLCGLVIGYAVLGAVVFQAIERPYEEEYQRTIRNSTKKLIQDLLTFTESQRVLKEHVWKAEADRLLKKYEENMVQAVNFAGYDGNDEEIKYQWTYLGALLYSITVFTTIGYGHICPKTGIGRGVTILYAMIGIPLMLLCLANIAETLAQLFTFMYFKICCAYCRWRKTRRRIKRAALSLRFSATSSMRRGPSARFRPMSQGSGLRRHASLRSYSSAPGRKTLSDTRSMKNYRGGGRDYRGMERIDQQKQWDSCSLPGGHSRGRDAESRSLPPPMRRGQSSRNMIVEESSIDSSAGRGFFSNASAKFRNFFEFGHSSRFDDGADVESQMDRSSKLVDVNNKTLPQSMGEYKKQRRFKIRCSSCCRPDNSEPSPVAESGSVFYTKEMSNSTTVGSGGGAIIEMKTIPSSGIGKSQRIRRASETTGQAVAEAGIESTEAKPGTISGNDTQLDKDQKERITIEEQRVPQIIISGNGKDDSALQIASDDEGNGEDDGTVYVDEEPPKPAAPMIPPAPVASSSLRSAILPPEERSTLSKRSDEVSLRSAARRTGNNYKAEKMPVIVGILTVVLFILGGAVLFALWEDWDLFEGAYFSFITLTTIGFGDIVPGRSLDGESQTKFIICSLYLLFGMALIAMCFKLMQDDVVQKTRWLGQKIGILVKTESSDEESEYEEEIGMEEEEEEMSEDRTEDKRTVSSGGSSKKDDEQETKQSSIERRGMKR